MASASSLADVATGQSQFVFIALITELLARNLCAEAKLKCEYFTDSFNSSYQVARQDKAKWVTRHQRCKVWCYVCIGTGK
jgi:hypothetical protein